MLYTLPILLCLYWYYIYTTEAAGSHTLAAENGSDSEGDDEVGAQAPPLTKQISNILNRYPEGGQILKVYIAALLNITLGYYIFHVRLENDILLYDNSEACSNFQAVRLRLWHH